jgi:diacylglycerol kinase family enzyme
MAARERYDAVVAFGGDGTVNEAANGLAGSDTALTCLPGGSANVFCKILGIPGDLVDATEHLLRIADEWSPRHVDLGRANGRAFTFSAGVGLDASVVERVDANPRRKARYGPWFFTWSALRAFNGRYLRNPPRMVVRTGGDSFSGVTTLVQNATPYTFFSRHPIEVARGATLESGSLAGAVLTRARPLDMPGLMWRAFRPGADVLGHRHVQSFSGVSEVTIETADGRPLPLQVDGDHIGDVQQAEFSLQPGGLLVVS